ncbi:sulfur carrier protein ThiS adenylyltransferase ThiF [Ruminococcus albus]|uniref:Sulfur carrier protein ThiS adenylyltransferase n=1 Tax=Ruminococcus albus TaxID=1264 RepID=A0A1I1H234_RUMAL|nr:sulfur carrier protein ThiS adenylyltransferase ThiF [Ruminococcus albus]SFC17805.1 sulfur carrier protein ThiS adenylyltransferase [Ruminococcus albus]
MIPSKEEMYSALEERHGKELQRRFAESAVVICGLGGLGSNVAVSLARAGVGKLHLIDFDKVDISNLNRQQYFPDQLGQYKSDALADTLRRIAPYCDITSRTVKLDESNIPELLADFPIICECFDNAEQKAMLVNTVLEYFPGKKLVAASGMAGLGSANTIVTRRIAKNFWLCGDGKSDVGGGLGLISARVAVCAAHQATMVLRIISGEEEA